jgi:hypothetical protein
MSQLFVLIIIYVEYIKNTTVNKPYDADVQSFLFRKSNILF